MRGCGQNLSRVYAPQDPHPGYLKTQEEGLFCPPASILMDGLEGQGDAFPKPCWVQAILLPTRREGVSTPAQMSMAQKQSHGALGSHRSICKAGKVG